MTVEALRGGLVVSVQAEPASVLNDPAAIALLARCAAANGAAGVRVEGAARIAAVRAALPEISLIGIVKCRHPGFEPYITSTEDEVRAVAEAGAGIVAFDATDRPRAGGAAVRDLVACARRYGLAAMADCSQEDDAALAIAASADIVATTLASYTAATAGRPLPALDLVRWIAERHSFAICEGGVATPEEAGAAFSAGAAAVVVGTALTNIDVLVRRFTAVAPRTAH